MKYSNKRHSKRVVNKKLLWAIVVVIVLIVGGLILARTRHKETSGVIPENTSNPTTNTNVTTDKPSAPVSSTPTVSSDKSTAAASNTNDGSGPIKPYGTFVSNHHPSLSGKDGVPSSMQSVCQGSFGAKCYLIFTKSGVTKSLPEKTIGSDGAVTWSWEVKTAGFSTGSWNIKAVSTLNNKTAETKDPILLEVQP